MVIKRLMIIFALTLSFVSTSPAVTKQNLPSQVQHDFETKVKNFYPKIAKAAHYLLYSLGVISFVLSLSFMAVKGEFEFGGILAQFIKYALIIGFFKILIDSPNYLKSIYEGLDTLGFQAGNTKFDNIINKIFDMWMKLYNESSILEPGKSLALFLVGIVATLALTHLVGTALMIYGFTIFSIYVGVFWLGFASYEHTRPWAINAIVNVIKWSSKWMLMLLLMAVTFMLIDDVLNKDMSNFDNLVILFVVSVIMVSISTGVTGFVEGYFTGAGGGDNNRGMQMALTAMSAGAGAVAGAAMGGIAGAKGAADTIAAAKGTGQEMGGFRKAGAYIAGGVGGMSNGALKGGMHGAESMTKDWARSISKNSSNSTSSSSFSNTTANKTPLSDGDVGGGVSGTIAEPQVGGEINK